MFSCFFLFVPRLKPDISKAERLLNWSPKIKLKDGLEKMVEDFEERMGLKK